LDIRSSATIALSLILCACSSVTTYSGTLRTEAVDVGSTVGGRVTSELVATGDRVHAGEVLVRLDDRSERAAVDEAQARVTATQNQLSALEATAVPAEIALMHSNVQEAQAALAAAQVALDETIIRTPSDGIVESIDLQPGDLLGPGLTAVVIDTLEDPYVRIYVPQRSLQEFRLGKNVTVRSDALSGATFSGIVEQQDLSAQFTPRDVQTAEDRGDLTFGIKIRVHDPQHRLYSGTTVTVTP